MSEHKKLDAKGALKAYPVRSLLFVFATPIFIFFIAMALMGTSYFGLPESGQITYSLLAALSGVLSIVSFFSLYGKVE